MNYFKRGHCQNALFTLHHLAISVLPPLDRKTATTRTTAVAASVTSSPVPRTPPLGLDSGRCPNVALQKAVAVRVSGGEILVKNVPFLEFILTDTLPQALSARQTTLATIPTVSRSKTQ